MDKLDSRLFDLKLKSWSMERELKSIQYILGITRDYSFTLSEIVRIESLIDSNKRDITKLNEILVSEKIIEK